MNNLLSLHSRVLSYLAEGVDTGVRQRGDQRPFDSVSPYLRLALEEIDNTLEIDCSHFFLRDIHDPTRLLVSTSSAKETIFRHERYVDTVPCLSNLTENSGTEIGLSRTLYDNDRLWTLLWETMAIGPYARPWSLVGFPLYEFSEARRTPIGYVMFIGPEGWHARNEHAANELFELMIPDLAWTATVLQVVSRLATLWDWQSASATGELVSAGQLHGVLAPLQRLELKLELTRNRVMSSQARSKITGGLDEIQGQIYEIKRCIVDFLGMRALLQSQGAAQQTKLSKQDYAHVKRLVDRHTESVEQFAQKRTKEIVLRVEDFDSIPISQTDFDLIFGNLIHNAIKYGRETSKIKVNAERRDNKATIEVISYGFGIRPTDRERIFEPGYRTAEASRIEFTAAGLGLYAARRAAESWGGHLYLKSSELENPWASSSGPYYRNTFRLELPAR